MDDPQALIQQAEKLVSKGSSGWSLFGGSDEKFWDAARLFKEAAQAYQMQGQNIQAGKTHERAGEIREKKIDDAVDAADSYVNASDAYRKHDNDAAIRCRLKAYDLIGKSTTENKANRRSRIKEMLGQIYEFDKELEIETDERVLNVKENDPKKREELRNAIRDMIRKGNLENARAAYKEASDLIRVERELNSNKLLTQYADISALVGHYREATDAYDKIINTMLGNGSMRWSLSTYCFKACICYLAAGDMVETRRQLQHYQQIDGEFSSQYKYKLIADLCDAVEELNGNKFTDLLYQFERTSRLDKWMTDIFLKIKEGIQEVVTNQDDEFA